LGTVHQGIGFTLPFEVVGASWADASVLAEYLNNQKIPGVYFRPLSYIVPNHDSAGARYCGVQIHVIDRNAINLTWVQFAVMDALDHLFPEHDIFLSAKREKLAGFDRAVGTDEVRAWFRNRIPVSSMMQYINEELIGFLAEREKYLLYK
jgi:uncharacterized protein YbbC (DUF1343 family)